MPLPTLFIVAAQTLGLLIGALVPALEHLRPVALPCLFVQTLIAVGSLAEAESKAPKGWAPRTLVIHHAAVSLPLMLAGVLLGLDTPIGVGAYVLGAVPTAAGLPSFAAAAGASVLPIIRYCLIAYAIGLPLTPLLVLVGVGGSGGSTSTIVLTLIGGLILPAILGTLGRHWLARMSRTLSFGIVAAAVLLVMLSLGPDLRIAIDSGLDDPKVLWIALAIGLGRSLGGGVIGALTAPKGLRLESTFGVAYKNTVLAALIAYGAMGSLATLPSLLSLFGEVILMLIAARLAARRRAADREESAPAHRR